MGSNKKTIPSAKSRSFLASLSLLTCCALMLDNSSAFLLRPLRSCRLGSCAEVSCSAGAASPEASSRRQYHDGFASKIGSCGRGRSRFALGMASEVGENEASAVTESAAEQAAKLRAVAAELRAQAEELEAVRDSQRQQAALQAFDSFDTNDDGAVDVKELISGLEGQLKIDFVKRLAKKIGRKPTEAEVDEKIAGMPGGVLFPEDIGRKLLEIYDKNGDGVLQPSEFAPEGDLRVRLEGLFAERAQEARVAAAAAREKEIEERGALKAKDAARARGLPSPEDFNDAPPTVGDKALAVLPYLLPLMDSLVFGAHIFQTYPQQLNFLEPLVAFLLIYRSLPFSGLFLFFGLQWFAGKPEVNKLVRFNCRQAVNIDIAMFFPSLFSFLAQVALGSDAAKLTPIAEVGSDVIFVVVVVSVLYSIGSSTLGVQPENLPFITRFNQERTRKDNEDSK